MNITDFQTLTPIDYGWSGDQKYRAVTPDGTPYFLRITPRQRGDRFVKLFDLQKAVAATGIPMCLPVAIGECEEGVYAVIKTGWIHTAHSEEGYPVAYWDEAFLLSCPDDPEGRPVTREELMEAIGEDPHIYRGEYGVPEEIPY